MNRKHARNRISRRDAVKFGVAGTLGGLSLPRMAAGHPSTGRQRALNRSQSGDEPVTLSYFYPVGVAGPLAEIMQGMVDDFNANHPAIQVEASFTGGYADTSTKVQTAVQGDNPPDVAVLLSTDLQTMLDLDAVAPLDDFIKGSSDFNADDFVPAFFNDTQVDDHTWCLPFQRSTPVLYYNKDAIKGAGLDPEVPPQTWDELVDVSGQIMSAGGATWGVEIPATTSAYWLFQALAIQAGQNLNGDDRAHVNFDTPEAIEALTWQVGLSTEHKIMPTGAIDWSAGPTDFSSGTTAFLYHSTGSLKSILSKAQFEVGTAFLPKDKQFGAPTGGGNIYIFKDIPEDHQQAAWTFLQWMTSTEQATNWSLASGYVPTRVSSTETDTWKDYVAETPQATTALEQLQYAKPELTGHQSGQLQKIMDDAVQAAVTQQAEPADALSNAQERADAILEQFR